jgi:heme-degrading monooxygenase HmoA
MVVRMWRGWAAAESAGEIAAHLRAGTLAQYAEQPGFVSAHLLERPLAGGVELLTLTTWRSAADVPAGVDEAHRLLVARETVAGCWAVVDPPVAVIRAA